MQINDVIVIGAGAAGLMCAIECAKRKRSVLVLESSSKIGSKIRISGGGRCNFTNKDSSYQNFVSENPHFCKSALAQYPPQNFIHLIEKYQIPYFEKKLGQLFCRDNAMAVIQILEEECATHQVKIKLNSKVTSVKKNQFFEVTCNQQTWQARSLVVATGGLSIPKMGGSGLGYEIAQQFGLPIIKPRPGLVPFLWQPQDLMRYGDCAGVSIDAVVRYNNHAFRENILFTHKGLSGPALLQISLYWQTNAPLTIDLLPEINILAEWQTGAKDKTHLHTSLAKHLPKRFTHIWAQEFFPNKTINQCSIKELNSFSQLVHNWKVFPRATAGYEIAEVTAGGVDTKELSSKTMETLSVPGLYFIGEVVDVTGQLGGHNFQWAWASGFTAGQYA